MIEPTYFPGGASLCIAHRLLGETASTRVYAQVSGSIESGGALTGEIERRMRVATERLLPWVHITANAALGDSVWTMLVDGVPTTEQVVIPAGSVGLHFGTGTITVGADQSVVWEIIPGGGPITWTAYGDVMRTTDGLTTVSPLVAYASSNTQYPQGTTGYARVFGSRGWAATETWARMRCLFDSVAGGMTICTAPGNYFRYSSLDADLALNGQLTESHLHWDATQRQTQEELLNMVATTLGDELSIRLMSSYNALETDTFEIEGFRLWLRSTTGYQFHGAAAAAQSSVSIVKNTGYVPIDGELKATATLALAQVPVMTRRTFFRLFVDEKSHIGTVPATLTLNVNGADTPLSVSIPPGATDYYAVDLDHAVTVNAGDLVCIKTVGPPTNNYVKVRAVGVASVEVG